MVFKLQKFGVDPECVLIKTNKEVSVISKCSSVLFTSVAVTNRCVLPLPQWSRELFTSFTYFIESYVTDLPSHIYADFDSAEHPLPVLAELCLLRCAGAEFRLCCVVQMIA